MITCKHFGSCGGCTYLDIPYQAELTQKEATLRETMGPYGLRLEGLIQAPSPQGYRNKMEFAFGDEGKDGQLALGIRKRRSYYEVATLENCVLIPDDFRQIALKVQEYFRETGEAFFHRKRHTGSLRHLVLRRGEFTGEVLINLSTTSGLVAELPPLISRLLGLQLNGQIVGILHSVNDGVADTVKDEDVRILHGCDYYHERICGLDFTVSAFSFFQTNSAGAEALYGVVKDMATGANHAIAAAARLPDPHGHKPHFNTSSAVSYIAPHLAYDLYCGTGTIAQILSPSFNKVIGIELNPDAIKAAQENARLNNITNCEFYAGDVLAALSTNNSQAQNQKILPNEMPDVVVVDPPRDGLHPKALAKLIELAPPSIVYVACKPASLARDMAALAEAGYQPVRIVGVDMFPRTPHVEAVALLRRSNTKNHNEQFNMTHSCALNKVEI